MIQAPIHDILMTNESSRVIEVNLGTEKSKEMKERQREGREERKRYRGGEGEKRRVTTNIGKHSTLPALV